MFEYRFAGMRIRTDREAASLTDELAADLDLTVRFAPGSAAETTGWHRLPEMRRTALLREDGRLAALEADDACPEERSWCVRQILPFAAGLQGQAMLHAAAICSEDTVYPVVGESGCGKSTLAEDLGACGLQVLADDLLPFQTKDGTAVVRTLRRGEAAELKIGSLFFLVRSADTEAFKIRYTPARETFLLLLRNGFGELDHRGLWKCLFESHAELAKLVPAYELTAPEGRASLRAAARDLANRLRSGTFRSGRLE